MPKLLPAHRRPSRGIVQIRRTEGTPVDRLWPGSTVVCLASGPSLTPADCAAVRGRARVIAVNNCYQLVPWADALYAADERWWRWHNGAKPFKGQKYGLAAARWSLRQMRGSADRWGVHLFGRGAETGLSCNPAILNTGKNSGYQAVNLAVHLGATRIVLLGYDMGLGPHGEMHWHPEHPIRTANLYGMFRARFATLVEPLRAAGVEIVNCTRRTALECFPCAPLESVLSARERVA